MSAGGEGITQRLRRLAGPIWRAQHEHPFIQGIASGTLDLDCFKHWLRQDCLFLKDYGRLFAIAASRSHNPQDMAQFSELAVSTLKEEMELHRSYSQEFGISMAELDREDKALITQAYTDFLLRCALLGSYPEMIAALLPCIWGFCEIGQMLAASASAANPYRKWIEMYSSAEFAEQAGWCIDLMERAGAGLSAEDLKTVEDAFLTSSRYEYLFWEMAYRQERWPV